MKISLRTRIVVYTTFSFTLVMIALWFILIELYQRYSFRSFDVTLQAAASSVANRLANENVYENTPNEQEDIYETIASFESKIGVIHLVFLDSNSKKNLAWNQDKLLVPPIQFRPGETFTSIHIDKKCYRVASANFEASETSQGTVLALASLSSTYEAINRMRGLVFLIIPITILILGVGSMAVARRALLPLKSIALEIDAIKLGKPFSRLTVPNTGDEITRVAESFNALLQRIETLIDAQRNFLLDASHELKTPLTVIQAEIEMLLMQTELTKEEREDFQQILFEVEYATKIAIDLIYLSRLETSQPLDRTVFDLGTLIREVVSHQQVIASQKRIVIQLNISLERNMRGDQELIRRLLANVIENAIKFSKRHGIIQVSTFDQHEATSAILLITDNGIGMEAEEIPKVFDRFYRTKQARSGDAKGCGLGLAIAKRIVDEHGGSISIESQSGRGTTVKIEFLVEAVSNTLNV